MRKKKTNKIEYPWIHKLGLTIITKNPDAGPGVSFAEIKEKLGNKKYKIFSEIFGCQTMSDNGPYTHDVENALNQLFTGKKPLFWD